MATESISDPNGDLEVNLTEALGASAAASEQVLTLYIPDKGRVGEELGTQRKWVLDAANLLARIGGGVTIMPPAEGGWFDAENNRIIWERPVVVYTYVKPDLFLERLSDLRVFLHRLGREANQGEVAIEFDGMFYRITNFDPAEEN